MIGAVRDQGADDAGTQERRLARATSAFDPHHGDPVLLVPALLEFLSQGASLFGAPAEKRVVPDVIGLQSLEGITVRRRQGQVQVPLHETSQLTDKGVLRIDDTNDVAATFHEGNQVDQLLEL